MFESGFYNGEKVFYENDVRVTQTAVKVLRWLIVVFPVLIILSVVGIFQSEIKNLIILTLAALVVTMGPTLAYKMNVPIRIMKYVTTIAKITKQTNLLAPDAGTFKEYTGSGKSDRAGIRDTEERNGRGGGILPSGERCVK